MDEVAAVNGELSFQTGLLFSQYSLAIAQRESGDYEVYHWPRLNGTEFLVFPNQNLRLLSKDPEVIKKRELIRVSSWRRRARDSSWKKRHSH